MNRLASIILFFFVCCNTVLVFAQNITVDDTYNAQQLVEKLSNSSCANLTNSNVIGDNFTPGQNSYGYFTNAGGSFPLKEGVVLSTWSSKNSIGPFVRNQGLGSNIWPGDTDLNQALGINSTINATYLEFDFTPLTSFLSFNYIFASNEYQDDFPCRYSDGFAFLIKEKGTTDNYQNLAIIPTTITPVSSTKIHPTITYTNSFGNVVGCPAVNETYFNGFNNAAGNTSPINYAGQTVVMNAQTAVVVGKTYRIKLVISDDLTKDYDSAVFLEAGSFSPKIDLGPDRDASANPICFGNTFTLDTKLPTTYGYKWFKDGSTTPIPSETNPTLNVTDSGVYKVEVTFLPTTCTSTDEIKIDYTPEIILSDTTITQCDDNGDGISIFNLTLADNIIKNANTSLSTVDYYESLANAQGKINKITNPTTYSNKPSIPILFARVENSFGCANYAQLSLNIANNTIPTQNPIYTCDDDGIQDGLYHFDLNAQVSPPLLSSLPPGMIAEYYLNTTDAIAQKNPLPNIFNNTTNPQIIYARIINGADCYGVIPIRLAVNKFDPPNFQDENAGLCNGASTVLSVASGFSSYLWNTGETTNSIVIITQGDYTVTVTDGNTCKATKKFKVSVSDVATITNVIVEDFSGNKNSVLIEYTGSGNYEFSLDGNYFQDSPLFTGIAPGIYFATARDKNGCGLSAPFEVYVLDYPRYFTPNGDGYNDVWIIKNIELFPQAKITIYNRYAKLLKELNNTNPSWNGKYLGTELPADDYWFNLNYGDGKIIKGHFSLKR